MCITQPGGHAVRAVLHNDLPLLENPPNLRNVYSNDLVNPPGEYIRLKQYLENKIKLKFPHNDPEVTEDVGGNFKKYTRFLFYVPVPGIMKFFAYWGFTGNVHFFTAYKNFILLCVLAVPL